VGGVEELGELRSAWRPAAAGSAYDFEARQGRRVLKLALKAQGVRDLQAAVVRLAQLLVEKPELKQACLAVGIPRVSRDRLEREWASLRGLFRPAIAERLALLSVGGEQPWTLPADPALGALAAAIHGKVAGKAPELQADYAPITPKFFEVFKVLLDHRLRKGGPVSIRELMARSGCSYPTVAESLKRLEASRELARRSNRSVELPEFPRRTWGEIVALSLSLRRPAHFADGGGKAPDLPALLRRVAAKAPPGLAVGGVSAARHWDPHFDLHGTPRIDLVLHAPDGRVDPARIRALDPALRPAKAAGAVVAVHPLRRPQPLFEPATRGKLPVADPVETLLDLHELGLAEQAGQLVERLERAGSA
jgi:hypothetical protein